ncbi:hypothetical protein EOS_16850 [Caballeronia mineralivorans PML1(12)]|uniref:Uncharacterized protein n=1 Tax=Caballeronia mineralivorans PML1(12) TaxID=908627 RepID=A0A0J1CWM8_9BURK|nr:hypothetical protein EOS_16850 [Caballeronia mineralivorans PML1(12)]
MNRRATDRTVERREMLTQVAEIDSPVDASQQVAVRNVIIEIERLENLALSAIQLTRHDGLILVLQYLNEPNHWDKKDLLTELTI